MSIHTHEVHICINTHTEYDYFLVKTHKHAQNKKTKKNQNIDSGNLENRR